MLCELRVRQLGVIEDLSLVLGPGMTALTGETGAGKTLVVEAVELLLGGRADSVLVRPGAAEAAAEGRFLREIGGPKAGVAAAGVAAAGVAAAGVAASEPGEVVLSRVVPKEGRSRAYIDGRMATAGSLAELGQLLVDIHGQHDHQSLLSVSAQREALDAYAGADRSRRERARERVRRIEKAMGDAGGSSEARQHEVEILEFQLAELESAKLTGADEDDRLAEEEEALAKAFEHRAAAGVAHEALTGEDQVIDRLGQVVARLAGHPPLAGLHARLRGLAAELADASAEARSLAESLEDDPERLAEVTERRALLSELRRKYGARAPATAGFSAGFRAGGRQGPRRGEDAGREAERGSLAAVFEWQEGARSRLQELCDLTSAAEQLTGEHAAAVDELRRASAELGATRRAAAEKLAAGVEGELRRLAMPRARFEVRFGRTGEDAGDALSASTGSSARSVAGASPATAPEGDALRGLSGEDVCFLFAANAGEPLLPLSKVASGGELARTMLALRLALLNGGERSGEVPGPGTLVFDEVDAGIGGEAALAVGRALAELALRYQVIVVTHLPQVAAFATAQVAVSKSERRGRTVATASEVSGEERVVELSRMLSGQPASKTARLHAEELLSSAEDLLRPAVVPPAKRARRRA